MGNTSRMALFYVNAMTMVFNMATRYVLPQWIVVIDNAYKTAKGMDELVLKKGINILHEKHIVFRSRYGRGYKFYSKVHSKMHPEPDPLPHETL